MNDQEQTTPADPGQSSFLLGLAHGVVRLLKKVLLENIVRSILRKPTPDFRFTDIWVLGGLACAIMAWLMASLGNPITYVIYALGVVRMLEIVVTNIDVMLGDPNSGEPYALQDYRRSLLISVMNFVEVMFWFAAFYRLNADAFNGTVKSVVGSLYLSMLTMATYGDVAPTTDSARWIVMIHLALALFLMLGVIARFVSLLPHAVISKAPPPAPRPTPAPAPALEAKPDAAADVLTDKKPDAADKGKAGT